MGVQRILLLILLSTLGAFAASVRESNTALRSGCSADADLVATLPAGLPVTLRFALSGESVPCYKVAVDMEGKRLDGYLPVWAMDGMEAFDQTRKSAAWLEVKASPAATSGAGSGSSGAAKRLSGIRVRATGAALHAKELIDQGRFDEAFVIVDAEAKKKPDAGLFALAGRAAMDADQNRRALDYFKASLDLEPNESVQTIYQGLLREVNADQSITKLYGVKTVLRFDGEAIPVETARETLSVVDGALLQVSAQLGCRPEEKIIAIAQTWDAYRQAWNAVEWSGGMFDGRIRVPLEKGKPLTSESRKTLIHEATHACLHTFGPLPSWLHEGLAQKLSGDTLPPGAQKTIADMVRSEKLPSLRQLSNGWSGMSADSARYAYAEALAAVELLFRDFGNDGVRNLLNNPGRIPGIAAELDKRLAQ